MPHKVRIPQIAAVQEAIIAEWLVAVGDTIKKGDAVANITVDKVTLELESPAAGVVRQILAESGEIVPAGEAVAIIGELNEEIPPEWRECRWEKRTIAQCPPPCEPMVGPGGAILPDDEVDVADGEPKPLSPMRAIISRRLIASKLSAPHFYLSTVVDMGAAIEFRKQLKQEGKPASFNDMVIRACGLGLRKYPRVAGVYTPAGIIPRNHMNIGFACAIGDEGLTVPVVRDADRKSLAAIAAETKSLVKRAREKKLTPDDYSGGVFSVSSLGMYDVHDFCAIINPGEAAILAVAKITETPVVVKGEVVIRPVMKLTLSGDHRVIDGVIGAKLAGCVKNLIENPKKLL